MNLDWSQHPKALMNLAIDSLMEQALKRREGELASNGAFAATTGAITGRSPTARYFVKEPSTEKEIDWGKTNQPISEADFEAHLAKITAHLKDREIFIHDGYACAKKEERFPIRVVTELAWHNLFAADLFLKYQAGEIPPKKPAMTIISAPKLNDLKVLVSFKHRMILISGTEYAGEMKKAIFTTLNFLLPGKDILTMHCSANQGHAEDVALFFGLSGTGKTTLSADPKRKLIGDDEHAWDQEGVYNLEGGCYAKCIGLKEEFEPEIFHAIKRGAVMENVILDPKTKVPNYDDRSLTENTRVGYPLEHIRNSLIPSIGSHPKVIFFLTADAFGVLPPISKLNPEQAMFHFLSGYTAKLAGTETGISIPKAAFSACFGAPFLPRPATYYGKMLQKKLARHHVPVYLINTGWTGGPYGIGRRISLPHTRALITACLEQKLKETTWVENAEFKLSFPTSCPGVPSEMLNPENTWSDKAAYRSQAAKLVKLFRENYAQFQ